MEILNIHKHTNTHTHTHTHKLNIDQIRESYRRSDWKKVTELHALKSRLLRNRILWKSTRETEIKRERDMRSYEK